MSLRSLVRRFQYQLSDNERKVALLKKWGVTIGSDCIIAGKVKWGSEPYLISIGDSVKITDGVRFITHDGGMHVLRNLNNGFKDADKFGEIRVGNNVFIGVGTIILPGVYIGDNVVIGAGSVVAKSIPQNSVACGVPAKVVESIEIYLEKASKQVIFTKHMNTEAKKKYVKAHFRGSESFNL